LRHTFRTVADEVGDRPAIDLIMGHEDSSDMATHYVERIGVERLRKITEHVRTWTFGSPPAAA
jgi:integrase